MCNLLMSIMQRVDVDLKTFGDSTGSLARLG